MQQIAAMVRKGDRESIQRYVKTQLPSDQVSLQRIYKELLQSGQKRKVDLTNQPQQQKNIKSHSMKALQYRPEDGAKGYEQRSNGLMRVLREKGFKVAGIQQDEGLKVFQQQRGKLVSPLITNSKLLQGGQAGIDRLIERYNANCDFYGNNIQDVIVDIGTSVDREMREFIDRRQAVLNSLRRNHISSLPKSQRYAAVPARVTQQTYRNTSSRQLPISRMSSRLSLHHQQSQGLMESCQQQIQTQRFKQISVNRNDFGALQRRLSGELDEDELDIGKVINLAKVREKMSRQQYQRYTHSYMKMMTNKNQEGSKCKLNPYAKELLQDERKMRNIIDFSQK